MKVPKEIKVNFVTLQESDFQDSNRTDPVGDFLRSTYRRFWLEKSFDEQAPPNT